jgi:hypothetical protein
MTDYTDTDPHPRHQEAADNFTTLVGVEGVSVFPVGHRSFEVEVVISDGDGFYDYFEFADEGEASNVLEALKGQLDYIEEQGLNRDDQQLFVAGFLDGWKR